MKDCQVAATMEKAVAASKTKRNNNRNIPVPMKEGTRLLCMHLSDTLARSICITFSCGALLSLLSLDRACARYLSSVTTIGCRCCLRNWAQPGTLVRCAEPSQRVTLAEGSRDVAKHTPPDPLLGKGGWEFDRFVNETIQGSEATSHFSASLFSSLLHAMGTTSFQPLRGGVTDEGVPTVTAVQHCNSS
eukprot:5982182-Amphidinium_carterae.1